MAAKKTAPTTKKKPRKQAKKKAANKAKPPGGAVPLGKPLKRPLTVAEMKPLLKMGDADRGIAARVGKTLVKHGAALGIPGVDSGAILGGIRDSEAIISDEQALAQRAALLMGARLLSDDKVWTAVVKLHRRLAVIGEDTPQVLADFEFLMEYMSKRSKHRSVAAAPASNGKPAK
ncbi:MAG: hypothetical protein ACHREM_03840 [Polyangiales bacterium]